MTEPKDLRLPGSIVTYSQNREDLYLYALVGHREPGRYVDIGCNDETVLSVTKTFYELGWCGLNLDANPRFRPEFERMRPRDVTLTIGVGESDGQLQFREYPDNDGWSTFDPEVMSIHAKAGIRFIDHQIRVRPIVDILDEVNFGPIDFMKIDVEGLEPEVLRGNDWAKYRPAVVVLEASNRQICDDILSKVGYREHFFDGLNCYFVANEADDVSIYKYSERVLSRPVHTQRELQLIARVDELSSLSPGADTPEGSADDGGPSQSIRFILAKAHRAKLLVCHGVRAAKVRWLDR